MSAQEVCVDCAPSGVPVDAAGRGGIAASSGSGGGGGAASDSPVGVSPTVPAAIAPSSSASVPAQSTAPAPEPMTLPQPTYPSLTIEFCDRCRWAPRATWVQTELFLTFPTPMIKRISLIPLTAPETGGRFRVWLELEPGSGSGRGAELVWDRKTEGGFPELKVLKQRIRNLISPDMGLGHSDKAGAEHKPFGQVQPQGQGHGQEQAQTQAQAARGTAPQ